MDVKVISKWALSYIYFCALKGRVQGGRLDVIAVRLHQQPCVGAVHLWSGQILYGGSQLDVNVISK